MLSTRRSRFMVFGLGCLWTLSCASTSSSQNAPAHSPKDTPAWVLRGSGPALDGNDKVLFGVGHSPMMADARRAQAEADNNALFFLDKEFQKFEYRLSKLEPKYYRSLQVSISASNEVIDHWINSENGDVYALARFMLKHYLVTVDADVAAEVNPRVEALFEELRREETAKRQTDPSFQPSP
jgi:hypothetical protein